jgi:hypothetical protein
MSRLILPLCVVILAGCSRVSNPASGVGPSTAAEAAVAKHIVERANEPSSVVFVKWGPNRGDTFRVAYRAKNESGNPQFYDRLFVVEKNMNVKLAGPNAGGDTWIEQLAPPKENKGGWDFGDPKH